MPRIKSTAQQDEIERVTVHTKCIEFRLYPLTDRAEILFYWPSKELREHWAGSIEDLIKLIQDSRSSGYEDHMGR